MKENSNVFSKKTAKKVVRRFLSFLGLRVSFIPRQRVHQGIVTGKVGKFNMLMSSDHTIVKNIERFPSYCANLPRLVELVKNKYKDASVIDVGANIGDGVALIRTQVDCPIICIEGDTEYFNLLKKNLVQFDDVLALNNFLGEKDTGISAAIVKEEGTLRIQDADSSEKKDSSDTFAITSLDSLSKKNEHQFSSAKVLKIDTDGYDLKILRGSIDLIKQNKPALFFEYDRVYLDSNGEYGLSIFGILKNLDYSSVLFYDNYGRFLISVSIEQMKEIEQLDAYIADKTGAFPYYDLCVFHKDDEDIAQRLVAEELVINKGK